MLSELQSIDVSLNQASWIQKDVPQELIEKIVRRYEVPEIIARLVALRDVPFDAIQTHIRPSLKNNFPDPFSLKSMEELAEYLTQSIVNKKKIAVFGDFDVDGATSVSILYHFFKHFGLTTPFYIPDRLQEGYGPNIQALENLQKQGAEIIIMVDCGTTAFDIVKQANDLGLEIIILDHHSPEESLPDAKFIVNPKRSDDSSSLDMLAACGVCFMVCVAVNNKIRQYNIAPEPDLKSMLDIVALGTVADMVPLIGINRLFVRYGFKIMQNTQNIGLKALISSAGIKDELSPYHAGFVLGPRINAGSRVHKADLGANLLCSADPEEALSIALTLEECNAKRKDIQKDMEKEALEIIKTNNIDDDPSIFVDSENWHPGLSGLVAGQLKEKYARPACVVTYTKNLNGEYEGRGSGRSIPGVNIAKIFVGAKDKGLIEKGGGHAMAGGFTIKPDKIKAFKAFVNESVKEQSNSQDPILETNIDAVITVQGVRVDLIRMIYDMLGPFGQGQAEPLFALMNVRMHSADIIGGSHIKLIVSDSEGGARMKAMAFRSVDSEMGEAFLQNQNKLFHILGHLKINSWNGRENAEMHVKDAVQVL